MAASVKSRVGARVEVRAMPCALAVGGLDPGGGAGIAADLRAFSAAGAFGAAAVAVMTVQSTAGLRAARPVPTREVRAQIEEVLAHQRVRAWKTGALGDVGNVRLVAALAAKHADIPLVVDPVMLPTRGVRRLLASQALRALVEDLLPCTSLVTANAAEAAAILGARVATVEDAVLAAERICELGARAALVKGGHLAVATRGPHRGLVTDVLCVNGHTTVLTAPRLALPPLHGGGCVLASLVAGRLARDPRPYTRDRADRMITEAVRWARRAHHRWLARAVDVGGTLAVLG